MSSSAADWSSLPAELLKIIAGDLKTIADYIRFRSVCRFWCAAAELSPGFVPQEFPHLMLPLNQSSGRCCFFNPLTNRHHYGRPLPELSASHRCIGSSLGRLILIDGSNDNIVSLNPLTGEKSVVKHSFVMKNKYYPSLFSNRYRKVILTSPNSLDPNNFSAFAISFDHVAYGKHGSRWWRRIGYNRTLGTYEDAIYFRGKLYLVNRRRSLATCDNRIYFTGNYDIRDYDVGVYNLADGKIERIHEESKYFLLRFDSWPVWFLPSLW